MKTIRPTLQYCIILGAFWASFAAISAYASVFLLANDFTNRQIGAVVAGGSILSAVLQPLTGTFADRRKKCALQRIIIVISAVIIMTAVLLLLPRRNFLFTALMYGLLIAYLQVLTPVTNSLGMFFLKKGISINFGIARGIGSICYAALSTLLGKLTVKYDVSFVMYATILTYLILIVSTAFFHFKGVSEENLPESPAEQATDESKNTLPLGAFLKKYKSFTIVLVGSVLLFVNHNIVNNYMFQIVSSHGLTSEHMGIAMSIAAAVELPTLFLYSFYNKKVSSGVLLKISGIFFCLKTFFLLIAINTAGIYLAQVFQMFGYGLYAGASVYYVSHVIDEENQVRGQSLMTVANTAGMVLGSFFGGLILDKAGVNALLIFSVSASAVGTLLIFIFGDRGKRL